MSVDVDAGIFLILLNAYDMSELTRRSCLSLQYVSSPIHTYCVGQACSMGSLLLAAGEKGKRHALPNASIMIHRTSTICLISPQFLLMTRTPFPISLEPSGGASGQASDIAIHAREILRVRQLLTGIYQRHCGREDESVEDGMQRFGTSHPI